MKYHYLLLLLCLALSGCANLYGHFKSTTNDMYEPKDGDRARVRVLNDDISVRGVGLPNSTCFSSLQDEKSGRIDLGFRHRDLKMPDPHRSKEQNEYIRSEFYVRANEPIVLILLGSCGVGMTFVPEKDHDYEVIFHTIKDGNFYQCSRIVHDITNGEAKPLKVRNSPSCPLTWKEQMIGKGK
ncbi:hypothetical protein [Cardiobacterium valvarum]|nr:hypothetical protein [Cardiobacterium valvarum]